MAIAFFNLRDYVGCQRPKTLLRVQKKRKELIVSAVTTVKSRAVDRYTIQFSTILGVLLTKTCYYSRRATIAKSSNESNDECIKGCINSFQFHYVCTFIYHDLSLFLKTNGVKSFYFFMQMHFHK